jgi:drug/metabolite transporter (DMT)-like permease
VGLQTTPAADMAAAAPKRGLTPMMLTIILILIPTISGVAGQLLLKVGMSQLGPLEISAAALPSLLWKVATTPTILIGLTIYIGGVFFWLLALSRADLSYVYPFASLSYVLITFASWAILHESVPPLRWLGLLVICAGVLIVAKS